MPQQIVAEPFSERMKRPLVMEVLEGTQALVKEFHETNATPAEIHECTVARYAAVEIAWTAIEDNRTAEHVQQVVNQLCDMADLLLAQHGTPGVRERMSKFIPDLEAACANMRRSMVALDLACRVMISHVEAEKDL